MRILVATAGDEPYNHAQQDVFVDLARADTVGEHQLESDPARADAILFVDLHQHPDDPFLATLRQHELARAYLDKVFVYDERDLPFFTFPGIYVAGTLRLARRRAMVGGPYPVLPNPLQPTAQEPDLLYSFLGSRTHPVREALFALKHERGLVEGASGANFFALRASASEAQLQRARTEYAAVIARSKFVLCPRGHGPSSFRLYEALAAGRVPVVISDDWLSPPRIDWSRCIVRVAEKDVQGVPQLLERLEADWPNMVTAGQDALGHHLARSRLWHHYATSIDELRRVPRTRAAPWWAQSQVLRVQIRSLRGAVRAAIRGPGDRRASSTSRTRRVRWPGRQRIRM
jgi:hypothetical protein